MNDLSIGTYAVDTRTGRTGRITANTPDGVRLELPGYYPPWTCPPDALRPAGTCEELRARVTELNWRRRLP